MNSVGSYEAKTHLPELLQRVQKGERIVITRRGKAVAMLVPYARTGKADVRQVIQSFKEYSRSRKCTLGKLTIREMIEEGRRH